MKVRLAIATMAIIVWGYAYAADDARLRLAGIILLAAALLLRFLPGNRSRNDTPAS